MRRVCLLAGLTVFLGWIGGIPDPAKCGGLWAATLQAAGFDTYPHWGCVGSQCVEIYECGVDDCTECAGCSPEDEWQCLVDEGDWNPETCTCSWPTCNPWDEQECAEQWGDWNPRRCTCSNPCNAGAAVPVWSDSGEQLLWCTGCEWGAINHWESTYYEQYCQDGRLWDAYTIETGWISEDWAPECWEWCYEL